jgi:hypothetical protein
MHFLKTKLNLRGFFSEINTYSFIEFIQKLYERTVCVCPVDSKITPPISLKILQFLISARNIYGVF